MGEIRTDENFGDRPREHCIYFNRKTFLRNMIPDLGFIFPEALKKTCILYVIQVSDRV
jgi:hypothetical protein